MTDQKKAEQHSNARFSFELPQQTLELVKRIASLEERPAAWVVRQAIDKYVRAYHFPPDQLNLMSRRAKHVTD